ncbi:glycosyltransferase [Spongiactinospora sp. TRM90649]|uniref:glycosyltransferase n=1 Tax=Spongiactinospora sp. TRM90649 TaxID=3031114 RepID=UPI0023FA2DF3|nr:glycosyltransferase [Spongiactinospora sp. TRM90649]MDF5752528.1 glycosyltransferase [Spongiactinospora sp. TRM90649]
MSTSPEASESVPTQEEAGEPSPPRRASPLGYKRTPTEGEAVLRASAQGWSVDDRPLGATVTEAQADELRPLHAVRVEWPGDARAPLDAVLGLAAAGVPLYAPRVPAWVPEADPGLAALLMAWDGTPPETSERPADVRSVADLRREEHSVRLRRHVHRAVNAADPTVTVIMSSMRPRLLKGALDQIARQRHARVEVVLGLHGVPESHPEVRRAVEGFPLPLTVLAAEASTPFGEVLHQAASRASGEHVAKWDDDDWYGPEHLADLLMAKEYSGADVVGAAPEFFYLEPLRATVRRTDYAGERWSDYIAGGTILLGRDAYRESGGFASLTSGVDADLLKRIDAAGGRIYRTHGLGYMLRRSLAGDHTWRLPLAHFLRVATNQWRGFRPSLIMEAGPDTTYQGAVVSEASRT